MTPETKLRKAEIGKLLSDSLVVFDQFQVKTTLCLSIWIYTLLRDLIKTNGVFFSTKKMCTFLKKNPILCLFLKNVSHSKRVVCFILNNFCLPMVEGIAFYALYKLRVLIIPCKADDFCLFIGLPDEISKKSPGIVIPFRI